MKSLWALLLLYISSVASGQAILVPWANCSSPNSRGNSPTQIAVSAIYAQVVSQPERHLNLTIFGSTPDQIIGESSDSQPLLATVFAATSRLTFVVASSTTSFCDSLRPPSPLPTINNVTNNYCPFPAGDLAFSSTAPLRHEYEIFGLNTRIRVVDSSSAALELLCLDISTDPLHDGVLNSVYGHAVIVFWTSVAITIAYWVIVGLARVASAWNRGQSAVPQKFWSHFQRVGFVLASAASGEKFASEPALLRFCTPSMRDLIFHTQWCAALGMIAVQWPSFTYAIFAQTAWATLTYNITLTQVTNSPSVHWDPLSVSAVPPPTGFSDQVSDPTSPLFIDANSPNTLLNLPIDAHDGIESFAYAVGLRPQDLFGICLSIFLMIVAGTIAISLFVWGLDRLLCIMTGVSDERRFIPTSRSSGPRWSLGAKETTGKAGTHAVPREYEEESLAIQNNTPRTPSRPVGAGSWWKRRLRRDSFHRDALSGNLIRLLLLFHLPITIFSAYEFSRPRSETSISPIVLAALSFVAFSIIIPALLVLRLSITKTNKLYDDTRTLLSMGPLYNQYASGSQTFAKLLFVSNLTLGVVVGCGQRSGTAQAIIILVAEVVSALWTSIYLPWGRGAAMGTISFVMCVARIITCVLLVILSPTVSVGVAAGSWIASAILLIQAIIYGLYLLMLVIKIMEAALRLAFRVPFNRSRHAVDSGLVGVLSLLGTFGRRRRKGSRHPRYKLAHTATSKGSLSSQDVMGKSLYETPSVAASRGPPSVLRPDQIGTPYREEPDDESGPILGAWPPHADAAEQAGPSQPKPGFSRVRGGRANFDSPYAIMSTTSQILGGEAGIPRQQTSESSSHSRRSSNLPQGAMAPTNPQSHIRQKSETGIIGDFATLRPTTSRMSPLGGPPLLVDDDDEDDDDDDEDEASPRRKRRWFGRRSANITAEDDKSSRWGFIRSRRRSQGDELAPTNVRDNEPLDGTAPSRSFVVVRDVRPSQPGPQARTSTEAVAF